jgi:hypothetical protein
MRGFCDVIHALIFGFLFILCFCNNHFLIAASSHAKYLEATVGSYPGTNSTSNGLVIIKFDPEASSSTFSSEENSYDITIFMDVFSVAPNCTTENNITNGCGIHIHVGTKSCKNSTSIGGHYWNELTYGNDVDPWLPVKYTSDTYGRSEDIIHMYGGNGFHASDNNYHTVILHDANGTRLACGVLSAIQWSSSQNDTASTITTTVTVNTTTTTTTTVSDDIY